MEFFTIVFLFCVGLFFIIWGGDTLVKAAVALKDKTGLSHVFIGATFISIATALPELFVSIIAVLNNNHSIAVGNSIGAMIANVSLVLALYLLFMPEPACRKQILPKAIFLAVIMGMVFLFAFNGRIAWFEGAILMKGFTTFIFLSVRATKGKRDESPVALRKTQGDKCEATPWRKIIISFCFAQILLITGAFLLVRYGERMAHWFNISEAVIGFSIIALGTTLPEIVTAIQSIRRKSGGLALGNVLGANIINATLLLGTSAMISQGGLPISPATIFVSLPVLFVASAIAIVPLIIRQRGSRWQGAILLAIYLAYLAYLTIVQPL